MKRIWDIADTPSAGNLSEDELYASIGRSLSCWERAEGELAQLFGLLVAEGADSTAAERAYGTLGAFRARMEMLEEASTVFIGKEAKRSDLKSEFKDLRTTYGNCVSRRNEIAHGIVIPYNYLCYMFGDPFAEAPGFCLISAEYNTSKRHANRTSKYVYTKREVDIYAGLFDGITVNARSLLVNIRRNFLEGGH